MRGLIRYMLAATLVVALAGATGCSKPEKTAELDPQVTPPAITTAGTLVAGVDLTMPPYAGKDGEREAGLDIDVAAAIAERLGLTLKTVQVAPSEAATALADGTADIVLSMPLDETSVMGATIAGTYVATGPSFFVAAGSGESSGSADSSASSDTSATAVTALTISQVARMKLGAQQGSAAFWLMDYDLGSGAVQPYPTLRAAFDALAVGQIDVVAGDALTGAYIARDFPGVAFAGQPTQASSLGVGVAAENSDLATAVREALDALSADGVLDAIRAKWVGELPALQSAGDAASSDSSATP